MGAFHPYPPYQGNATRPNQVAPGIGPSYWRPPPAVTENKAIASLLLGLLSMACIGPFVGLPAIVLGAIARRDIERSNGALAGRGLAACGIVSGLFGTGFGVVATLWVIGALFTPDGADAADAEVEVPLLLTQQSPGANAQNPQSPRPEVEAEPATRTRSASGSRSYGSLEVVDLDDARPLRGQLAEILARSHGRTVVLQTYVRSSATCDAIAAALPDSRMQGALTNVTIVRVDVEEYPRDLTAMKVEIRSAPWFYRLDGRGAPTDALNAEGWETPVSMAPLLGRFVQHPARRARP